MERVNITDRTEQLERKYQRLICSAWLPVTGDYCVRRPGHRHDHRSEYAMENARYMKSGHTERVRWTK